MDSFSPPGPLSPPDFPSLPDSPSHPSTPPPEPNRRLKILHTEAATGMGGQEIYIFRHMQVMRALGHDVSLLCQPHARLAQLARDHGFVVHTLKMGGLWRMLRGILAVFLLARQQRYDVVNTTSRRDTLIAAAGARLAGTPLVVRSRHLMSPVNSLLTYTGLPHRVITVSQFVKQLLIQRGIAENRIAVVPPIAAAACWDHAGQARTPQALRQARERVRAELGFGPEDVVFGCVAILREPKGHQELLRAIAPLCRSLPKVHLVIVGDGEPMMSRLLALREALGLQQQVHLLGYRADACTLMPGFDVFTLASQREAAGTVMLEAALAGVPIVATRVAGIPEMVAEGENALLVEPGNLGALTAALAAMAHHPERRRAMGKAGLAWANAQHHFTAAGHGQTTQRHYYTWLKELLNG